MPDRLANCITSQVKKQIVGEKCGDSIEIIFVQSCRLIRGGEMFRSLENATVTQSSSSTRDLVL